VKDEFGGGSPPSIRICRQTVFHPHWLVQGGLWLYRSGTKTWSRPRGVAVGYWARVGEGFESVFVIDLLEEDAPPSWRTISLICRTSDSDCWIEGRPKGEDILATWRREAGSSEKLGTAPARRVLKPASSRKCGGPFPLSEDNGNVAGTGRNRRGDESGRLRAGEIAKDKIINVKNGTLRAIAQ